MESNMAMYISREGRCVLEAGPDEWIEGDMVDFVEVKQ